ncbi:MAG: serine hydrolase [Chitinophagaceae bacterium]
MKHPFSTALSLASLFLTVGTYSCHKAVIDAPAPKNEAIQFAGETTTSTAEPNFQKLADTLAFRLKGKCTGYSLVVSYKGAYKTTRAGGFSRTSADAAARAFTMYDKFNIASVSKTITATALMKQIMEMPGGVNNVDELIWPYLPAHWVKGPNIKGITFRQLLNHTSGIVYDKTPNNNNNGDDYQTLKTLVAAGVVIANKVPSYNNRNFALMRLLIPAIAKYNIVAISSGTTGPILTALENAQAIQFANAYKDYCTINIFNKLNSTAAQPVDCVSKEANPSLSYPFPYNFTKGLNLANDNSLIAGAQGWVMNTIQVNDFFTTLNYTQTLLPYGVAKFMRDNLFGYDNSGTTNDNIKWYWKNGIYDYTINGVSGSYRSLIIGFSDDIQVTMMTNSPLNLQNVAILGHQDWYQ